MDKLSFLQKKVIYKIFIKNYTVSEIANELNISRQAVNEAKIRALSNIKAYLMATNKDMCISKGGFYDGKAVS